MADNFFVISQTVKPYFKGISSRRTKYDVAICSQKWKYYRQDHRCINITICSDNKCLIPEYFKFCKIHVS